jgi:hypothetical protein
MAEHTGPKICLITYHAAHNYGSVLQAYATQYSIEKLGCECEIINFRTHSQKYSYSLYKIPLGIKILSKRQCLEPVYRIIKLSKYHNARVVRAKKFEYFINHILKTTREYNSVKSIYHANFQYDLAVTGSDQTWNIHCGEMILEKIDCACVYYLDFAKDIPKAAFAASIGHMTEDELVKKRDFLEKYDYIATRETAGKHKLEKIINKSIDVVLDPTFLLSMGEWLEVLKISDKPLLPVPYVLLYSLGRDVPVWTTQIQKFVQDKSLKIVCITPFYFKRIEGVIQLYDIGPLDFLNLYNHAKYVFADSFHGMVFSIIFRKSFLVLGGKYYKNDIRKKSLLQILHLESRLIDDESDINTHKAIDLDYSKYETIIQEHIDHSMMCLKKIINLVR